MCPMCHDTKILVIPGEQMYSKEVTCWFCKPKKEHEHQAAVMQSKRQESTEASA